MLTVVTIFKLFQKLFDDYLNTRLVYNFRISQNIFLLNNKLPEFIYIFKRKTILGRNIYHLIQTNFTITTYMCMPPKQIFN